MSAGTALVVGAGMTRFGKFPERGVRSLATEAVNVALDDAGVSVSDVQMVFFSNAVAGVLHGQEMVRGQSALRDTGLLGVPIVNVENACASASSAFSLAASAVRSGAVEVALAIGAEKLTHADKRRSVRAIATAVDLEEDLDTRNDVHRELLGIELDAATPSGEQRSKFMDIYAEMTVGYMEQSGATREDLAAVAVKSHANASNNPNAQYRMPVTVEEVLASRVVSDPLTVLMCSPIGDGAAALVLCSSEFAARLGVPTVSVAASAIVSGYGDPDRGMTAVPRAAAAAYEQASLGPDEVDLAEVHDAAATGELMMSEELGLCAPGDAPKMLRSGDTSIGGRLPVNPSGGLLSRGHPIGATGCAQLVELVDQLRGRAGDRQVDGARVALAQNAGGHVGGDAAAAVVTILQA